MVRVANHSHPSYSQVSNQSLLACDEQLSAGVQNRSRSGFESSQRALLAESEKTIEFARTPRSSMMSATCTPGDLHEVGRVVDALAGRGTRRIRVFGNRTGTPFHSFSLVGGHSPSITPASGSVPQGRRDASRLAPSRPLQAEVRVSPCRTARTGRCRPTPFG